MQKKSKDILVLFLEIYKFNYKKQEKEKENIFKQKKMSKIKPESFYKHHQQLLQILNQVQIKKIKKKKFTKKIFILFSLNTPT